MTKHYKSTQEEHRRFERKIYKYGIEIGMVLSLLLILGLFQMNIKFDSGDNDLLLEEQVVVEMEEITQTQQIETPPPPPAALIPIEVPDDVLMEEEFVFDSELELDEVLEITGPPRQAAPPPPEPEEEEIVDEPEIFIVVEQMPELVGGIQSLQSQIEYPEMARRAGVQGQVMIQFVVNEDGSVSDPVVLRGIGGGCDEEAIRVVKLAKFQPGKQRGKPVKVRFALPIRFSLR